MDPKSFLTSLFDAAVAAADPMRVLAQYLPERPKGRLVVIGAGKASARMAEAVEAHYGPCQGLVITRYGYERPTKGIEIVSASHPVPDQAGVDATRRMMEMVSGLGADDTVISLISGGGSSLLCAPAFGLELADKMDLTRQLLACGAPISEINTVRKPLSLVKGGKLAQACAPARVINLLISDVPGDDPAFIASGPTVANTTTARDALALVDKWGLSISDKIRTVLEAEPDVIPFLDTIETKIIAAPSQSLQAASDAAGDMEVIILGDDLEGEARELAQSHAQYVQTILSKSRSRPTLILSGGECTVTRRGDGIGGPNAEYTLAMALALDGLSGVHVLACDTDGVDGAAEVAGAYAGPDTLARAKTLGVDAQSALDQNDAHRFFERLGDQIVPGPTLTNVNDFRAILITRD